METLIKYQPKTTKEFIGNRIQIKRLFDILRNPSNEQKLIALMGPNGCGKSTLINAVAKELNIQVLEIFENSKDLATIIQQYCIHKTIESFFKPQRKIIIIENIEIMLDKQFITSIMTSLGHIKKRNMFIVMTGYLKPQDEKKLLDFKKELDIIKVHFPSIKDSFAYLMDILIQREEVDISADNLLTLVTQYKGSIRDVILSVQDSNEIYADYKTEHQFKDMNSFEIAKKIFSNSNQYHIKDIDALMQDDPHIIAFLMYENFPDELHANFSLTFDDYAHMNQSFIDSCHLEDLVFKHSDWSCYSLVYWIRIMHIIFAMQKTTKKKTTKDVKYRFSQLLSKISHKNILTKKMKEFEIEEIIEMMGSVLRLEPKARKALVVETHFINSFEKYFVQQVQSVEQ